MKTMFEHICEIVCEGEYFTMEELMVSYRGKDIVFARQLIMYFAMNKKVGTLDSIGKQFNKNHATVYTSIKCIENYIDTDKRKRRMISDYGKKIDDAIKNQENNNKIKRLLKPLENEVSLLEQRIINLQISLKNAIDLIDKLT